MTWPWGAENVSWARVSQRQLRATRKVWPNPIPRARKYQQALKTEGSYRKVAKRFGVTRQEVFQYVAVVTRLPASIVRTVETEKNPLLVRRFSLRALLAIARLGEPKAQLATFQKLVAA